MDNVKNVDQYNIEIAEAMKRMDSGDFYTHEEVVKLSESWLVDIKKTNPTDKVPSSSERR